MGHLKQVRPVMAWNRQRFLRTVGALSVVAIAACLGPMGCGGSGPTTPSTPTIDLSGTWTGTWTFMTAGATITDTVSMTVTQSGTSAVGLWSSSSGPGGRATFSVGSTLSGSTTISQTLLSGGNCLSSASISGSASSSRIQFTMGTLAVGGLCQWATNQTFVFTR